jgi:5-methylcytosine-specific restriction protein A
MCFEGLLVYVKRAAKRHFFRRNGQPYVEPHHLNRLADGGPDHLRFVAAVCPTCHRRVHYGSEGDDYNLQVSKRILQVELD